MSGTGLHRYCYWRQNIVLDNMYHDGPYLDYALRISVFMIWYEFLVDGLILSACFLTFV